VIGHFGSLAKNRNLGDVLAALAQVLTAHPAHRAHVRLRTYGGPWDEVSRAALAAFPFRDVVEDVGRLETDPATGRSGRERVLAAMRQTDVLLLLHGDDAFSEEYFPSKLYEYLWMQRPILGVIHGNDDLARLLAGHGHVAVRAGDVASLAAAIAALLERWRDGGLPDSGQPSPFPAAAAVAQIVAWTRPQPAARPSA
jgi:glycosyltransferase involved in cell wall biosynthesis